MATLISMDEFNKLSYAGIAKAFGIYDIPSIKKIIVSNNATIVIWSDGTKTRATCSQSDSFDPVVGLGQCLLKKLYGKKKIERMLKRIEYQTKYLPEDDVPF